MRVQVVVVVVVVVVEVGDGGEEWEVFEHVTGHDAIASAKGSSSWIYRKSGGTPAPLFFESSLFGSGRSLLGEVVCVFVIRTPRGQKIGEKRG